MFITILTLYLYCKYIYKCAGIYLQLFNNDLGRPLQDKKGLFTIYLFS